MRKIKIKNLCLIAVAATFYLRSSFVFAQGVKDEKQEEQLKKITEEAASLEKEIEGMKALKARWNSNIRTSYGYENNPKLAVLHKGDHFVASRYSLNYRKTFAERNQFGWAFDLNHQNYSEVTDISSTLSHMRFDYKLAFTKNYVLGTAYDFSYSVYAFDQNSTYYDHKMALNIQHRVTANFYHQLQLEMGWKLYENALAYLNSTSTYQDNLRKDTREAVEYSFGYTFNKRFSSNVRLARSFNNSNASFQDYYDYHAWDLSPRFFYKVNDRFSLNSSYSYQFKDYTSRIVSNGSFEQKDRISTGKVGLSYQLNARHSFTFDYTYRQNASNDILSDYTASTYEGGWRYIF